MTDGSDCSATPTLTAGIMTSSTADLNQAGANFSGISQSGFVFNGQYYSGEFQISSSSGDYSVSSTEKTLVVDEIIWDQWLYGQSSNAGGISVSIDSDFIQNGLGTNLKSGLFIKTGRNRIGYMNPSTAANEAVCYAGVGDYSTLISQTANNLTITPQSDGTYEIEYLKYGYGE